MNRDLLWKEFWRIRNKNPQKALEILRKLKSSNKVKIDRKKCRSCRGK